MKQSPVSLELPETFGNLWSPMPHILNFLGLIGAGAPPKLWFFGGPKNMLPLPSDNDSDPWLSNTVFAAMAHVMGLGDFDDFLQMGEEVDKSDWSDLDALKNFGD